MNAEELSSLLDRLDPDRERAAERYEAIRKKLIRLFEWRGAPLPEDLADETFDRVARGLAQGLVIQAADPYSYFCGVAFRVHQEQVRKRARKDSFIENGDWQHLYPPAEEETEDPRLECLRRCLDRLSAEQRRLVLGYHAGEDRIRSRQQLAQSLGDSLNALRIKAHRVRRQLESCLASCLGDPGEAEK